VYHSEAGTGKGSRLRLDLLKYLAREVKKQKKKKLGESDLGRKDKETRTAFPSGTTNRRGRPLEGDKEDAYDGTALRKESKK